MKDMKMQSTKRRQKWAPFLLLSAFCLLPFVAFGQAKSSLLVIGHPTGHDWKIPQHSSYEVKVIDRDLLPRTADAYTRFAALFGVVGDPLYVVVTPHMEPVAASSSIEFLDRIAAADHAKLLAEAGLAVRKYLLSGGPWASDGDWRFKQGNEAVARSRMYDHIGGGFFRSPDRFDKSTADQARLALRYLGAWEHDHNPLFAEVVRRTLDYALAELQDRNGLFVAGANADSLVPRGGPVLLEGGYYLWRSAEVRHLLGPKVGDRVVSYYGIAADRDTLPLPKGPLTDELRNARARMLEVRLKRPKPQWHSPIVTSYNAEMISALARASVAFDEPRYATAAIRAARALRPRTLTPRDHALFTRALFDAYEATFDIALLERAMSLLPGEPERVPEPVAALVPKEDVRVPSLDDLPQIIIAGDRSRDDTKAMIRAARAEEAMVFLIDSERTRRRLAAWMPYVSDIVAADKQPVAMLCENRSCRKWTN